MSTIFWSWQSDLDARVTRNLIRDALALAIEDLHAELDERPELTSDTQGVAGSPDIVATILAKIEAAAVFVGDVTPIAISASGKAVTKLTDAYEDEALRAQAFERIRALIEAVVLTPECGDLTIELRGELASILELSACADMQNAPEAVASEALQIKVVAGTGFEPVTFRL